MVSPNLEGLKPILAALSTMQANVERSQKSQAHEYLEKFQKSVRAKLVIYATVYEPD